MTVVDLVLVLIVLDRICTMRGRTTAMGGETMRHTIIACDLCDQRIYRNGWLIEEGAI